MTVAFYDHTLLCPAKREPIVRLFATLTNTSPAEFRIKPKRYRKRFWTWMGVSRSRLRAHSLKVLARLGMMRVAAVHTMAASGILLPTPLPKNPCISYRSPAEVLAGLGFMRLAAIHAMA